MDRQAVILRKIKQADCVEISEAFAQQGWDKPVAQYENYLSMQQSGERDVIIAEIQNEFAGYLTISWESQYPYFKERGIPEIVDFNVLKKYQRKGLGSLLMEEAERRVQKVSPHCGIGVGVTPDYGPAQILYVRRNYIPVGKGLAKSTTTLNYGDQIEIDHDIVFHLIKKL